MAQLTASVANSFVPTGVMVEGLSAAAVFVVLPADQTIPAATKRTLSGRQVTECDGSFPDAETFGDVTLVTMQGT